MKKINLLILLFIVSLFCSLTVKAIPNLYEVDVKVVKESGIKLKNSDEILEYDSIIKVAKLGDDVLYKGTEKINENDIEVIDNTFDNEIIETLDYNVDIKVINRDGVKLYAGPSLLYPIVIGNISEGTTLKATSIDRFNETFLYTSYNGVKGWLYTYNSDIAIKKESNLYTLKNSYEIYSYPAKNASKKIVSTQKDSIISYSYVLDKEDSTWYYVDKYSGWIKEEKQGSFVDSTKHTVLNEYNNNAVLIISDRNIPIYKDLELVSRENKMIPTNTVVKLKYHYVLISDDFTTQTNYYYIEYDNVNGWIKEDDTSKTILSSKGGNFLYLGDDTSTYKTFDLNAKSDKLNYFNKVNGFQFDFYNGSTTSYMYYINLNNNFAWLKESNSDNMVLEDTNNTSNYVKDNIYLYDNNDTTSNVIGAVKKNTYFKEIYSILIPSLTDGCNSYWKYINYLNTSGWIHVNKCQTNEYTNFDDYELDDEALKQINEANNVKKVEEEVIQKEEEIKKNYLIYIIIGIVIVIIIVILILILKNKNKKPIIYEFK